MSENGTVEVLKSPVQGDDFETRVQKLMEVTKDPESFRRMQVEMYIFLSDFDKAMQMFTASSGPMGGIMARMMGMKPGGK